MTDVLKGLNWRYATKKFDPNRKINDDQLNVILESLRLTPTSYGIQALKFLVVEDEKIREELVEASYNQQQVKDASHLIVICAFDSLSEQDADSYMKLISETRGTDVEKLEGFRNMIVNSVVNMEPAKQKTWMRKQAYIALGQLMHTCATLRIDATPMEGFEAAKYNSILDLGEKNLHATLVCPIGYRHEDDPVQHLPKVRKSLDDLIERI
jgi:nitroreductase